MEIEPATATSSSQNESNINNRNISSKYDDDEDEDVCRICRNGGDADNPLRYPCACSGSIKFVHQDCLLQWLNHSHARTCEVCKHPFSFSPVYATNAPMRLPVHEFLMGIAMKALHVLQFFVRLSFVLSVWLLIIPFMTFWIWRLAFVRSFAEAHKLFVGHISTTAVLTDCLHGFLLSASIVFIFLGATSLRDYFRHLREIGVQDGDRDVGDRNGAGVARGHPRQANRVDDVNGIDAGGARGVAGAGQLIRRNAENVAAQWEMQAGRLEAHMDQIFDGMDDADGAEDVPFDELIGMQGPVFHLVENAFTVLASNMIFIGVVILVPFTLGRVIAYYLFWLLSSATNLVLAAVVSFTESTVSLANATMLKVLLAGINMTSNNHETLVNQVAEKMRSNASVLADLSNNGTAALSTDLLKGETHGTSRFTTLAVGYMFIFSLVFFYLGLIALIRYVKGEPLAVGRFYGISTIVETVPSLFRQFLAAMRHLLTMIKVAFLLVIELGVFPIMCGWWLDVCTVRMCGKSIAERVDFFSVSPLASSVIHWIVGIVYMLQISLFVSLLRGVLRNGVLYFLRDPADPNYNPFRDLIDDPVHKHARRLLLSVAVYGSLIVMLVYLPAKLAMQVAPSIFPLDMSVYDPFTEVPAVLLLFQICIPFAIKHFKLRTTIKSLLRYWFTSVGCVLSLTDFLLPAPEVNSVQENRNAQPLRQGGQQPQLGGQPALEGLDPHALNSNRNSEASANIADEYDNDEESDADFVLRIVLLLLMAWMTLLVFNSALVVIPVSLGRVLFNAIPTLPVTHGIKSNDLYSFVIGSYVICTAVAGARYTNEYIITRRTADLLNYIWKWCGILLKSSALLSIWVFVIPVLIGLLFELLVIAPMRVPVDESPIFLLYQDWALGLIFLKIWTRLVMLDHMIPLADESWRVKFERVRENGFSRLQGFWVLREIVIPVIMKLLTALCVPYVLARGVFPIFGYPVVVNSAVYRFAWLGCLVLGLVCFCAKRFHVCFTNLHNSIRDDIYLIGRRLHNFREEKDVRQIVAAVDLAKPDPNMEDGGSLHNGEGADAVLRQRHVIGQDV
ncbi:putative E3 ubiquitin ligase SUD1 isoform X2 [Apium graveolens]|uniref:putative E3 ubiquitin ligase SUD1 isoform X2 n=1 Tax=Apium graveolens TaxID=4045 RepID=UPI003D7B2BE8